MTRFYTIIILLSILSCRKDIEPKEPYFTFDEVSDQVLSGLKLNDSIHFEGSNGSIRTFKIFKIEKIKQTVQDCSWNFGTCEIYYHYDFMQIHFLRTDTIPPYPNSPITASLLKQMYLPSDIDKKNIPKDVQARMGVYGSSLVDFNIIPTQGPVPASPYITYPDYYVPINFTSFSNAVRTYAEVVIIKSGNNAVYVDPYSGHRYTVNEVWFDKKYGIVFFKNVFGNSWSRTN